MMFDPTTYVRPAPVSVKGQNGNRRPGHAPGDAPERRRARRHYDVNGMQRAAVTRALVAAERLQAGLEPTLAVAAVSCGVSVGYVRAAQALLFQAPDEMLLNLALKGHLPFLYAAELVRRLRRAIVAFRKLHVHEQAVFGQEIGVGYLWDHCISPTL